MRVRPRTVWSAEGAEPLRVLPQVSHERLGVVGSEELPEPVVGGGTLTSLKLLVNGLLRDARLAVTTPGAYAVELQVNGVSRVAAVLSCCWRPDPHSELTEQGGDPQVQAAARAAAQELGMPAAAVADAIAYAVSQPDTVDVNEIIMRSTAQG